MLGRISVFYFSCLWKIQPWRNVIKSVGDRMLYPNFSILWYLRGAIPRTPADAKVRCSKYPVSISSFMWPQKAFKVLWEALESHIWFFRKWKWLFRTLKGLQKAGEGLLAYSYAVPFYSYAFAACLVTLFTLCLHCKHTVYIESLQARSCQFILWKKPWTMEDGGLLICWMGSTRHKLWLGS